MILGQVHGYLPRVALGLRARSGQLTTIEFTLDTGFDGDLTLPSRLLGNLSSLYLGERVLRLADGSLQQRALYEVVVDWNGQERLAEVHVLENPPLLGATLLDGHLVSLEMTEGGEVTIDAL